MQRLLLMTGLAALCTAGAQTVTLKPDQLPIGFTLTSAWDPKDPKRASGNPLLQYQHVQLRQFGTSFPRDQFITTAGLNSTYGSLPLNVEFQTNAKTVLARVFSYGGGKYRFWVNGKPGEVRADVPVNDGRGYLLELTFPTAALRTIRLETQLPFGGIAVSTGSRLAATPVRSVPRAVFLGDSITEGAGGDAAFTSYAYTVGRAMGWETWGSGSGGTGYLAKGPFDRVKFRDRVQTDVIAQKPDIVIVAGGRNDAPFNPEEIGAEALALLRDIQQGAPKAKLVVLAPWHPSGGSYPGLLAQRDALKAAAGAVGAVFIDPITEGWITGTGNVATPKGDGNADQYISADGVHPTQAGHDYYARRLTAALKKLGL